MRGQPGGGLHGRALLGAVDRFRDEDDVDVGDVVQLVPTALAHRDDGEPALRGVGGCGRTGDGERRPQGRGGQIGQFGGGLGDVGRPAHVAGRYGQQAAAVGDAQRVGVVRPGEALLEFGHARVEVGGLVRDEGLPVAGVAGEVVAERLGRTEHPEQPVPQGLGGDEGVQQDLPLVRLLGLHQPGEPVQGQIGVCGGAERFEQHRVGAYRRQLGQVEQPLGGGGIGEAVPQQSGERAAPAPRHRRHSVLSRSPLTHHPAFRA